MKTNNLHDQCNTAYFIHSFFIIPVVILINTFCVSAQPCNPYPGYTTWLGYTDSWEDSTNWCPSIAPVATNPSMNIRIPGGPSGTYTYYRPVIKAGVYAVTNNLRIETGDTLFILAANQSTLTVNDSLIIEGGTSAMIVNNSSINYPIFVRGHWENNGFFDAGESRVTFDGLISNQQIGGLSMSTFFDLDISNSSHVLRITDFTVSNTLNLINGRLKLNLGMMTILNPSLSAITRINGSIQSEMDLISANVHPFGRLNWKMGSIPGLRSIPFVNSFGAIIFMNYEILSGVHDVVLGTYGTNPDNTNLPLPEVTNVYNYTNGLIDSSGYTVVDRFYLINNFMGISPVANITFRYSAPEQAASGNILMGAQRWLNSSNIWENPLLPGQTFIQGSGGTVLLTNISDVVFATSEWWTISNLFSPLGTGLMNAEIEFASVYPNPAYSGEVLKMTFNDPSFIPDLLQLFSADGREIIRENFEQRKNSFQIPHVIPAGLYTIMLKSAVKTETVRLVILDR